MDVFLTSPGMALRWMGSGGRPLSTIFKPRSLLVIPTANKSSVHSRPNTLLRWAEIANCPCVPSGKRSMLNALLRKFEMHQDLCTLLLDTKEEAIVENSPSDYYWGCGADGSGQNTLGKLLMQVRSLLSQRITQTKE